MKPGVLEREFNRPAQLDAAGGRHNSARGSPGWTFHEYDERPRNVNSSFLTAQGISRVLSRTGWRSLIPRPESGIIHGAPGSTGMKEEMKELYAEGIPSHGCPKS